MKFSICNEMFEGWKLDDVFKYSAELGYDGVEVAHFTICDSVTEARAPQPSLLTTKSLSTYRFHTGRIDPPLHSKPKDCLSLPSGAQHNPIPV